MSLNVLFIPGLGGDPSMWKAVASDMLPQMQLHYGSVLKGESVAELARRVLMDAPDKFVAIGFSLGGWVAMELARIAPKRVLGLGLISTTDGTMSAQTIAAMKASQQQILEQDLAIVIQQSLAHYFTPDDLKHDAMIASYQAMMLRVGAEICMQQYQLIIDFKGPMPFLSSLHCPTIVLRGEQDERIPFSMTQDLCQVIASAQYRGIKSASHYVPLSQPQRVAKCLNQWLSKLSSH
ncbi:alpha/beta hydrolase [uncultured Shewanella sp.]|uniref:alpha/beta fold hydrolase n=1 Tax=uncultured Shewanella sp. TaxID=173975 RepID=UPI002626F0DC|nr:alpha/beta hydrolase [uncultured Shewanella sp.]